MIRIRNSSLVLALALAQLALPLAGCSKKLTLPAVENQRPTVKFSQAPTRSGDLYSYAYEMHWVGFDPDGEVQTFLYAVDPPAPTAAAPEPDTVWTETDLNSQSVHFTATRPQPPVPGAPEIATDYHVFVIQAVDNRGLHSARSIVGFNSSTVAPLARILEPTPYSSLRQFVTPSVRISWEGEDPDGIASREPLFYRVKLFTPSTEISASLLQARPDTLRKYYEPRHWAGWDSVGSDVNSRQLTGLIPETDYAFVVIAFDEAGACTPYVSGDQNVLYFRALYANFGGPILTIFNEYFTYTYIYALYRPNDPRYEVFVELPAYQEITFNWSASVSQGTFVKDYRWVLDPEDLLNERPRANERTDWNLWSTRNARTTSGTVGPFTAAGDHKFYIEVTDGNGIRSLGVVHFQIVTAIFDKELAIVDDTRFLLDRKSLGATTCIDRPISRWPMAAELDTFLYARGGCPMKCYPAGSFSKPGLFKGYEYDTLGTLTGRVDIGPTLGKLARYRKLIWLVDPVGAGDTGPGNDPANAMTAMRYYNAGGRLNVLAAYLKLGGDIWLLGGGCATAATNAFNVNSNDVGGVRTFSAAAGELRPNRFVYDLVHWQTEFKAVSGNLTFQRSLGRFESNPGAYALFPPLLQNKSLALGDSLPVGRTGGGDFYVAAMDAEILTRAANVVEDVDPDPDHEQMAVVMDTIYRAVGAAIPAGNAAMTIYHGPNNGRVIETGIPIWNISRSQSIPFIDAVMKGIWGFNRQPEPTRLAPTRPRAWLPTDDAASRSAPAREIATAKRR